MSVSATGAAPAARPGSSGRPAAARRLLVRWLLPFLVSGAILVYLFAAQGVDPWALVPLVQAISLPGLAAYVAVSAAGLVLRALACARRAGPIRDDDSNRERNQREKRVCDHGWRDKARRQA